MKYFENTLSLEDAGRKYKQLAKQHHPDIGGDVEIMKSVNVEYESFLKRKQVQSPTEFSQWSKYNMDSIKTLFPGMTNQEVEQVLRVSVAIATAIATSGILSGYFKFKKKA